MLTPRRLGLGTAVRGTTTRVSILSTACRQRLFCQPRIRASTYMDESWNRLSDDERSALGLYHQLESLHAMRDRGDLVPQLTLLKAALGSSHLELVFDSVINAADGEAYPAILQPLTVLLAALGPDERWLLHYRLALAGYRESMLEVAGGFADAAN